MVTSIIAQKSFIFGTKIINFYKEMFAKNKDMILARQILKSGTSIGANVREAISAESKRDFLSKITIALKEAKETQYWVELFIATGYIDKEKSDLLKDCNELCKMLSATVTTTKRNL